jgi:hypothetical protein
MITLIRNLPTRVVFLRARTRRRGESILIARHNDFLDLEGHVQGNRLETLLIPGENGFRGRDDGEPLRHKPGVFGVELDDFLWGGFDQCITVGLEEIVDFLLVCTICERRSDLREVRTDLLTTSSRWYGKEPKIDYL